MPVRRWVGWRTTMHTFGTKHFCLDGVGAASSSHRVFCASPAPRGPHPLSSRSTVALTLLLGPSLLGIHCRRVTGRVTYTIDSQFSQRIPVFFPPTKDAYSSTRREKVENWLACGR